MQTKILPSVLPSIIIIIIATFSVLTYYKLKDLPEDNCCINMKIPEHQSCYDCESYNLPQKIIYVWKYT